MGSEMCIRDSTETSQATFIENEEYLEIDLDVLFGGNAEIDLLTSVFHSDFREIPTNIGYNADYITLNRTGAATSGSATSQFAGNVLTNGTWELTDSRSLTLSFDNTVTGTAVPFVNSISFLNDNFATYITSLDGNIGGVVNGISVVRDTAQLPASESDVTGALNLPIPISGNSPFYFWLDLQSGGRAEQASAFDSDGDGILEQTEAGALANFWEVDLDGNIVIREYRFPNNQIGCDPNVNTDCIVFRERIINIANRNGNNVFALEMFRFFLDADSTEPTFDQLRPRLYEFSTTPPIDVSSLPPGP